MNGTITGVVLLAICVALIVYARPNKLGESPRFLQFDAAPMIYTPIVMAFFIFGAAELLYTWG